MLGSDKGLIPPLNSQNMRHRVALQINENIQTQAKVMISNESESNLMHFELALSCHNLKFYVMSIGCDMLIIAEDCSFN